MMMRKVLGMFLGMGMMIFMVGQAYAQEPTCKTAYGETACGYNCTANYGVVNCSSTPQGACAANYGQVVCWDPPRWVDQKAECLANYGEVVCGYNCIANYGEVRCSLTPQGACAANYGQVVCWDPPYWADQKAECLANYGIVKCGYNCVANYGVVRCAQTPNGICRAENGDVRCYDLQRRKAKWNAFECNE